MKKFMALISAAVVMAAVLTGCGSSEEAAAPDGQTEELAEAATPSEETAAPSEEEAAPSEEEAAPSEEKAPEEASGELSGTIVMAGSTSMEKLANAAAEVFMEKYPEVLVTAEFTGSGAGIEAVTSGSVDIGNSSRALKDDEKAAGIVENIVAIDGIAVVVNPANIVEGLTKDQLASIYKGEVTNWSELGGNDEPIVVVGREASSGTRGGFEELLEIEDMCAYANELDSTGAVIAKVGSTAGAIGYASLDAIDDSVKALKLDGVEATADTIKEGTYFLSRPFVMATKGEISEQSEAVQEFFNFLKSEEGKEVISGVGLVLVD